MKIHEIVEEIGGSTVWLKVIEYIGWAIAFAVFGVIGYSASLLFYKALVTLWP